MSASPSGATATALPASRLSLRLACQQRVVGACDSTWARRGNRRDETRPDLLLLDIALPDLSGLDVCREVRRRRGCLRCGPSVAVKRPTDGSSSTLPCTSSGAPCERNCKATAGLPSQAPRGVGSRSPFRRETSSSCLRSGMRSARPRVAAQLALLVVESTDVGTPNQLFSSSAAHRVLPGEESAEGRGHQPGRAPERPARRAFPVTRTSAPAGG